MSTPNFHTTFDANKQEILSIARQLNFAKPGQEIVAYGAKFKVEGYSAKNSPIKGTLPAVKVIGLKQDDLQPVMSVLSLIAVNPVFFPQQRGGYLVREAGKLIGLVIGGNLWDTHSNVYAELTYGQ
jgi:hypothetical protein